MVTVEELVDEGCIAAADRPAHASQIQPPAEGSQPEMIVLTELVLRVAVEVRVEPLLELLILFGYPLGEDALDFLGVPAVLVAHPAEEPGELSVAAALGPPRQSLVPVSVLHGYVVQSILHAACLHDSELSTDKIICQMHIVSMV